LEIHPPQGKVRSLKDFGIHILIVTIGILIALSLDGFRETVRKHNLVRDARENFREELTDNRSKLLREIKNLSDTRQAVDHAIAGVKDARIGQDATEFTDTIKPTFYLFRSTSWEAALSTGALGNMRTQEVTRHADAHASTQVYSAFEDKTVDTFFEMKAIASAGKLTQERKETLSMKLLLLAQQEQAMAHLADELLRSYDAALKD
jgi:hypothetical protein